MSPTIAAAIIELAVIAALYVLHRLALAGPLADILVRRDRTREMSNDTRTLLGKIEQATTQLYSELEMSSLLAEQLPSVERLIYQERCQRYQAPIQARRESLRSILAILLTTPTYMHAWREYRAAQILLKQATWQLIKIKHVIGMDDSRLELQPIIDLIREHEQGIIEGTFMDMCEPCNHGREYECTRRIERRGDSSVPFLSCRQQKLLAAIVPQERDWAFALLKVSK